MNPVSLFSNVLFLFAQDGAKLSNQEVFNVVTLLIKDK